MSVTPNRFRSVPRPCVDSLSSLYDALSVACLAISRPLHAHTIVLSLDDAMRGVGLSVFPAVSSEVVRTIAKTIRLYSEVTSVVLVSVRPHTPTQRSDQLIHQYMSSVFTTAGFALHDWVVVGRGGLYCPRSLLNVPDPWPSSALNL